eukprot:14646220-Alexandrium_andersonii.AAC.1
MPRAPAQYTSNTYARAPLHLHRKPVMTKRLSGTQLLLSTLFQRVRCLSHCAARLSVDALLPSQSPPS